MSEQERIVFDPYEPPEAPDATTDPGAAEAFRSVALVVLLFLLTGGIYGTYWLWERRKFLQQRRVFVRVGPVVLGLLSLLDAALLVTVSRGVAQRTVVQLIVADAIVRLVAVFGMRDALNTWAASLGARGPRSLYGTWFFGVFYLQYVMNRIARRGTPDAT